MKIKTEILQTIYILTCEGPCLIPSTVEVFLTAMKAMIEKKHLDILFDLSDVTFVAGVQLETVCRSFETIEGHGRLIVSGLSERDRKIIKITHPHLEDKLIQAPSRNEALSNLYWENQNAPSIIIPIAPEVPAEKGEIVTSPESEKIDLREVVTAGESKEKGREGASAAEVVDLETGTDKTLQKKKGKVKQAGKRKTAAVEKRDVQPFEGREHRRFDRIESRQIMDGDFHMFCKSTVTGKNYVAIVQNIGMGGVLMTLAPPRIADNEELIVEGRIGRDFKFKEKVVFHSRRGQVFVFEFVDLSPKSIVFMKRLYMSLNMRIPQ